MSVGIVYTVARAADGTARLTITQNQPRISGTTYQKKRGYKQMNTNQIRNKLLAVFPTDQRDNVAKIVDTLIQRAIDDGKKIGHKEAATMIEVLVLGNADGDIDPAKLTDLMQTLRG